MCMSAPLPGYRSTTPIVPARSPAVAVDLFVALGGRLVQMRGAQEAKDGPALTKINRPPPPPGPKGPRRGRSFPPPAPEPVSPWRYCGSRLTRGRVGSEAIGLQRDAADPPISARDATMSA